VGKELLPSPGFLNTSHNTHKYTNIVKCPLDAGSRSASQNNSPPYMETDDDSFLCPKNLLMDPSEPLESSPYPGIHYNIPMPCTPKSGNYVLPFRFSQ
jgi:hypothetical protein